LKIRESFHFLDTEDWLNEGSRAQDDRVGAGGFGVDHGLVDDIWIGAVT
jgi:hypothetical protein